MRVLITGVAGLIGSQLAKHLLSKPEITKVIGVDNLSGGYRENIIEPTATNPNGVLFVGGDCADAAEMGWIFHNYKIDVVFHCAAYAAEGLSPFIRNFNYQNNLLATANIVNNCINHNCKLIFTSSMAVYGNGQAPFAESDVPKPCDPYGVAKYSCEQDIQIAGEQHGLNWCIIRPHNVFGPHQNIWDKYRNVLGIWMNQHLQGKPLTVFGDGEQQRAFTYVGDILEPLYNAIEVNGEIINLGSYQEIKLIDAARILIKVMGGGTIEHVQNRHEVKHAYCTYKKSVDLLGYELKTDLIEGLKIMWEWAKQQPPRESFKWPAYEVNKGIYDYWK